MIMKKILFFSMVLLLVARSTQAQVSRSEINPRFEIGVVIGEPTGISAKYWLTRHDAIDASAAWSFSDGGNFDLYVDYLRHFFHFGYDAGELPLFFGLGAAALLGDDSSMKIRVSLGAEFLFARAPLSLILIVAPTVELVPDTELGMNAGIQVHLVF